METIFLCLLRLNFFWQISLARRQNLLSFYGILTWFNSARKTLGHNVFNVYLFLSIAMSSNSWYPLHSKYFFFIEHVMFHDIDFKGLLPLLSLSFYLICPSEIVLHMCIVITSFPKLGPTRIFTLLVCDDLQ